MRWWIGKSMGSLLLHVSPQPRTDGFTCLLVFRKKIINLGRVGLPERVRSKLAVRAMPGIVVRGLGRESRTATVRARVAWKAWEGEGRVK